MFSYSEIFNIKKTTLPINKNDLSNVLSKKSFMGYVQCPYTRLVDTLKEISAASEYQISVNPQELYANGTNPFHQAECVIQVEGLRSFDEFVNRVVANEDTKEWTDFITYSETFRSEIMTLKAQVIHKYLWNIENINNWFNESGISIPTSRKQELVLDFAEFKKSVLLTNDLQSFINSCDEGALQRAANCLAKNAIVKLQKYKHELDHHVSNNTLREPSITVKNPIISRIFVVSNRSRQCEKEWPKIRFTSLDRRSLEALSLWNGDR